MARKSLNYSICSKKWGGVFLSSYKINYIVIRKKILFVVKKTTKYTVGGEGGGTSCTLQKMGIKLTRSLLFVHII